MCGRAKVGQTLATLSGLRDVFGVCNALSTFDGVDAEPRPSHNLGIDWSINFELNHSFTVRLEFSFQATFLHAARCLFCIFPTTT